LLTSLANPIVKEILSLQHKTKSGGLKFVVEGVHLVEEVFQAGNLYAVESMVFSSGFLTGKSAAGILSRARGEKIKTLAVSDKVFGRISGLENPEGVLAVLKAKTFSFAELLGRCPKLCLLACEIQDPGNLGTIFRSAEAFGVDCILLSRGSVDPFNGKAVRASMGSVLRLPYAWVLDAAGALGELRENHFEVVAADARRGENLGTLRFNFPLVLVVGNEARGLSQNLVDNISKFVKISMQGKVESLNVAIATSIVLYQIRLTGKVKR